ncbi:hypothetical protein LAD67_10005 [Escherichia coli]|nr:hypothetical protein [Escherichia coli]
MVTCTAMRWMLADCVGQKWRPNEHALFTLVRRTVNHEWDEEYPNKVE